MKIIKYFEDYVATQNFLLSAVFFIGCVPYAFSSVLRSSDFCYNDPSCGPETWGGSCQGSFQSPIDLPQRNDMDSLDASDIYLQNYQTPLEKITLINTGHSVQFQSSDESAYSLPRTLISDTLSAPYKFVQAHVHFGSSNSQGSEHTISGQSFPAEIHLVHIQSVYNSLEEALASNSNQALAVIGIFVEIGEENKELEKIASKVFEVPEPSNKVTFNASVNLASLFPSGASTIYRYFGSLTTPNCNEQVEWTVFGEPIHCSQDQLDRFRRYLRDSHGHAMSDNYRPVQNLNQRIVKVLNVHMYTS